ncbi:MAG: hypothetical protein H7124_00685 [Phycisphaerales bacterium]|nr:hypothetical protein [Hyphomonadaceae bacterium]
MRAPIPQRIATLSWRNPAFLWTPLSLALAIAWPAALFWQQPNLARLTLVSGMLVFALALSSLGAIWALGRAPKSRRAVLLHVLCAGALVALLAPFALTGLLGALGAYRDADAGAALSLADSLAIAPLALIVGLPVALISGIIFAWLALSRRAPENLDRRRCVPFRRRPKGAVFTARRRCVSADRRP